MAAPSGTTWGSIVGGYGRIGIYTSLSTTNTAVTMTTQIWFWSKYSVSDTSNSLYYTMSSSASSAVDVIGSKSISTTVSSGTGWSTSNQKKIFEYKHAAITRTTAAQTRYLYTKLANVDRVGGTMYASKTVSIPKLASYTVKYNANGGSGAPSSQTKWYGKSLTLSKTKPTRTGYTFQGWGTTSTDTSVDYASGASYTGNAALTLYAIWKANTFTVKYNANGGSGAPGNQTKTYGVALTLSNTKPTRTNYTFKGWGTSASSTTVAYAAGASYTANAAITLYAIWELSYKKPRITSFSADRCDSSGNISDEGTNALIKFNWATDLAMDSIVFDWKLSTDNSYSNSTTYTVTGGTSGTVSQVIGSNSLASDHTYDIMVTVSDSNGVTSKTTIVEGLKFSIDLLAGGGGVSFGKPAELEDTADFNYELRLRKKSISTYEDTGYIQEREDTGTNVGFGIGSGGNNHGIWNGKLGKWIYKCDGSDITIGSEHGDVRPYYRAGDVVNIYMRTAGYVTNSKTNVCFTIPLSRPVIGSPDVTITSIDGLTMRQGGNYTHGSSATVYANVSSYTATLNAGGNFIFVTATINDTTNAVNNDATGIYVSVKVTFS